MTSTTKTPLNHYGTLGLPTTATDDEIRQAFAKAMFAPHRMADAAQIGMAYEVLRNPAKRRAYDQAMGLRPATAPAQAVPSAVAFRISARVVGTPPETQVAELPASPPGQREPAPERAMGSFIAQSLREPVKEAPALPPPPPEMEIEQPVAAPIAPEGPVVGREADRPRWSRTGLTVGGLALTVVFVGAWAGLEAGNASEADAADVVTAQLPKPRPVATQAAPAQAAQVPVSARTEPVSFAALRIRPPLPTNRRAQSERLAEVGQSLGPDETAAPESTTETAAADPPAADAPAIETAAAATLPLPGKTIARTLHRIGYGCGEVASTTAVEDGIYKVTCTSGQSYRAAPVHGRYRFKRWAGD